MQGFVAFCEKIKKISQKLTKRTKGWNNSIYQISFARANTFGKTTDEQASKAKREAPSVSSVTSCEKMILQEQTEITEGSNNFSYHTSYTQTNKFGKNHG